MKTAPESVQQERTHERCGCVVLWHRGSIDVPQFYSIRRCTLHDSAGEMFALLTQACSGMSERNPLGRSIRRVLSLIRKDGTL